MTDQEKIDRAMGDAAVAFNHWLSNGLEQHMSYIKDLTGVVPQQEGVWMALLIMERINRVQLKARGMDQQAQVVFIRAARMIGDRMFDLFEKAMAEPDERDLTPEEKAKVKATVEDALTAAAAAINMPGGEA